MKNLYHLVRELKPLEFNEEKIDSHILAYNLEKVKNFIPNYLITKYFTELNDVQRGYTLVNNLLEEHDFMHFKDEEVKLFLTAFCSLFATPIKVIDALGLWIKIDINLNNEMNRAGGDGYLPLHNDLVNTRNPPDNVALFCFKPDPLGGGATIISNIQNALGLATEKFGMRIKEMMFTEGKYFGLKGVGEELNPFPLVEKISDHRSRYRFTSRLLDLIVDKSSLEYEVIEFINETLLSAATKIMLKRGDLILLNQNIVVHGRTSVGSNQLDLEYVNRRVIYQMFLRTNASSKI